MALDQTQCGFLPVRPAKYHLFTEVRPPASGPGSGTWRDCLPTFPDVDFSMDLYQGAMSSLNNQPVENHFRIIFQGTDGDLSCDPGYFLAR